MLQSNHAPGPNMRAFCHSYRLQGNPRLRPCSHAARASVGTLIRILKPLLKGLQKVLLRMQASASSASFCKSQPKAPLV